MRMLLFLFFAGPLFAAEPSTEPLFDAIRGGDAGSVKRALASGIKANARDGEGIPALMMAALFARADVLQLLIDRGANVNAATSNGDTALMWAVPAVEKVRILLGHGADVKARSAQVGPNADV